MTAVTRLVHRASRLLGALFSLTVLLALLLGVPWGLWHYIGWPLPDHLPSSDEIQAVLLNPMSTTLLLNILACIAWPVWLVFAFDTARCVPDALRGIRSPTAGPIHVLAGALVAAVLIGSSGYRDMAPPPASITELTAHPPPAATQLYTPPNIQPVAFTTKLSHELPAVTSEPGGISVRGPQHGVHDSLWRIAQREAGAGSRWPELFDANHGRAQLDGDVLADPSLIRPGWVLLRPTSWIPTSAPFPAAAPSRPAQPSVPPPAPSAPRTSEAPAPAQVIPAPQQDITGAPSSGSGIDLVTGAFLATGLTGAVAAALAVQRRRRRRVYRPGSGTTEPVQPLAPVVRALRIADDHHRMVLFDHGDNSPVLLDDARSACHHDLPELSEEPERGPSELTHGTQIGVLDGRALAVDLAALHGLGITGAGAEAAVRALLVHLLATTTTVVVIPRADAVRLLGPDLPSSSRLRITDNLDAATTELVEDLRGRATSDTATMALVAALDAPDSRLQSLLDNGGDRGIIGILLGHWPPGGTVRVNSDGIVTAASPPIDDSLREAHLFHANATDTRDLIELFSDAQPPIIRLTQEEPRKSVAPEATDKDGRSAEKLMPRSTVDGDNVAASEVNSEAAETATSVPQVSASATAEAGNGDDDARNETTTQAQPTTPFLLSIFGQVELRHRLTDGREQDVGTMLAPKHRALLVFLALHPRGTTREVVREALWSEARGRRPFNAFYATLSQIRKILDQATDDQARELITQHGERVALNPQVVGVDYWQFDDADHARRIAVTDAGRLAAWSRIASLYRGEIGDGVAALWLDAPREAAHRTVVDALAGMAAHYRGTDPHRRLQLLEHARLLDPDNEDIYRDIMRTQADLGMADAISRTLQLLSTTLAETGDRPATDTLTLARALQARQHHQAAAS